jgi:hypothetical protein
MIRHLNQVQECAPLGFRETAKREAFKTREFHAVCLTPGLHHARNPGLRVRVNFRRGLWVNSEVVKVHNSGVSAFRNGVDAKLFQPGWPDGSQGYCCAVGRECSSQVTQTVLRGGNSWQGWPGDNGRPGESGKDSACADMVGRENSNRETKTRSVAGDSSEVSRPCWCPGMFASKVFPRTQDKPRGPVEISGL